MADESLGDPNSPLFLTLPPSNMALVDGREFRIQTAKMATTLAWHVPNRVTFTSRGKDYLVLDLDQTPPTVELLGDTPPDEAAKKFWNAVALVVERPALFPEVETVT